MIAGSASAPAWLTYIALAVGLISLVLQSATYTVGGHRVVVTGGIPEDLAGKLPPNVHTVTVSNRRRGEVTIARLFLAEADVRNLILRGESSFQWPVSNTFITRGQPPQVRLKGQDSITWVIELQNLLEDWEPYPQPSAQKFRFGVMLGNGKSRYSRIRFKKEWVTRSNG
jgi:hypothetical protein